jgi:hypothetical protein
METYWKKKIEIENSHFYLDRGKFFQKFKASISKKKKKYQQETPETRETQKTKN